MTIMYISIALIAHNPQFNSQLQKIDSSDEVPSSRGGILTSDKVWLSYWNESLSWDSVNISPGRIVNQHCYQQPPLHRFSNTALLDLKHGNKEKGEKCATWKLSLFGLFIENIKIQPKLFHYLAGKKPFSLACC